MHKRILSVILSFGLIFSVSGRVLAEPSLNEQLNTSNDQYNQSQQDINAAKNKASNAATQVEILDGKIHKGMQELASINDQISKKQADIKTAEESIKKSEADIKDEQELYNKRIRAMYMSGSTGYISVILESDGINDLMSKIETVQRITEYDKEILTDLNNRKQELQQKKQLLVSDEDKLNSLKNESQNKLNTLNAQKAEQIPLIAQANAEEAAAIAQSSAAQAQIAAINKKLAAIKAAQAAQAAQAARAKTTGKNTSAGSSISVPTSYSSDNVITYAETFMGVSYVWGGTSPSGFDCSGFVQYVYSHFGITLPRTSEEQYGVGSAVDKSNLQPGDLVFFNWGEDGIPGPGHVGMYIGGGQMIDAPHTGASVHVSDLSYHPNYVGARRVK